MMHLSLRLLSFILFLLAAGSGAVGWQDTLDRTPSPAPETDTVSVDVRADAERFAVVMRCIAGRRLTYEQLTGKSQATQHD